MLFPVAGILMDRFGRKFSGIPSCLVMVRFAERPGVESCMLQGAGFMVLALVADGFLLLASASVIVGAGNGLSSGLIATLGQVHSLAPQAVGMLGRTG